MHNLGSAHRRGLRARKRACTGGVVKRVVYRVLPDAEHGWRVERDGALWRNALVGWGSKKETLLLIARREARHVWEQHGIHTQLVVHKKNGQIQTEHTYGADPRRSKG